MRTELHNLDAFKYKPKGPRESTVKKVCVFLIALSEMKDENGIHVQYMTSEQVYKVCKTHRLGRSLIYSMKRLNYLSKHSHGVTQLLLARGSVSSQIATRILQETNRYQAERYAKAREVLMQPTPVNELESNSNQTRTNKNLIAIPKSAIDDAATFTSYADAKKFVMTKSEDYVIVNVLSATETSKKLVEFTDDFK